jgi:hypothetical protein
MASILSTERQGVAFTGARAASSPVHVVRLAEIGLDREAFVRDVRPSFDRTAWDMYDVATRRAQIEGDSSLTDAERRLAADAVEPHRRRAMRKYRLEHRGASRWEIAFSDDRSFTQAVTDYRARTREFALIEPDVSAQDGVLALLASTAETVRAYRPNAARIDAVLHQVSVFARPAQAGSPAPEGVHQDGADFIVSALVVERSGVNGGVSRVREGRDGAPFLEIELAPGEGIFQADGGTQLWHEISPISLAAGAATGHRMTFGIDIHVS